MSTGKFLFVFSAVIDRRFRKVGFAEIFWGLSSFLISFPAHSGFNPGMISG
jgi:hypothetical protein